MSIDSETVPAKHAKISMDVAVLKTKFDSFEKTQALVLTFTGLNFMGVLVTILAIIIKVF